MENDNTAKLFQDVLHEIHKLYSSDQNFRSQDVPNT